MLNQILNMKGVTTLSKSTQKEIKGGGTRTCCEWNPQGVCCQWGYGSPSNPCAFTVPDPNCD